MDNLRSYCPKTICSISVGIKKATELRHLGSRKKHGEMVLEDFYHFHRKRSIHNTEDQIHLRSEPWMGTTFFILNL